MSAIEAKALDILIDFCDDEPLRETARKGLADLRARAGLVPGLVEVLDARLNCDCSTCLYKQEYSCGDWYCAYPSHKLTDMQKKKCSILIYNYGERDRCKLYKPNKKNEIAHKTLAEAQRVIEEKTKDAKQGGNYERD